jgi:hypothetical protein
MSESSDDVTNMEQVPRLTFRERKSEHDGVANINNNNLLRIGIRLADLRPVVWQLCSR